MIDSLFADRPYQYSRDLIWLILRIRFEVIVGRIHRRSGSGLFLGNVKITLKTTAAGTATLQASLLEIINIPGKLGSGYQRDLQRIKAPLFKAIDLTGDSCEIMALLISNLEFLPDNIDLDPAIYAAGRANRIVLEEGLSFRDAYRRVAEELDRNEDD